MIIGGGGREAHAAASPPATPTSSTLPFASVEDTAAAFDRVRARLRRGGPRPGVDDLLGRPGAVLRQGRGRVARRAAAIGRDPTSCARTAWPGTPAEVVDKIGAYAEAGATRVYLQILDLADLDHLDLLASEVLPQV